MYDGQVYAGTTAEAALERLAHKQTSDFAGSEWYVMEMDALQRVVG